MPQDPIARIKQMLAPAVSAKAKRVAEETMRSPMADTLWQISGGGKPIQTTSQMGTIPTRLKGAVASYVPFLDVVSLDPSALQYDEDSMRSDATQSLSHEAGHRADSRRSDAPGRNASFEVPKPTGSLSPLEQKARGMVDWYYQTSPDEGYAQAFGNAMSILRNSPRMLQEGATREDYVKGLAEAESVTPGVGGVVEALLKEKPFQQHPLQRVYKRKEVKR